jgi:hypothetical protein
MPPTENNDPVREQEKTNSQSEKLQITKDGIVATGRFPIIVVSGILAVMILVFLISPDARNLLNVLFSQTSNTVASTPEYTSTTVSEVQDLSTARHDMHTCPIGQYVVGAHGPKNLLLCANYQPPYSPAEEFVERTSRKEGMIVCPDGNAMTGWHARDDEIVCAPIQGFSERQVFEGQVRQGTFACSQGMVMVGIHQIGPERICAFN